ncbi:uncharacterized protein LOC115171576 isoform X2 [Salmo trutta]|uniref:uncharacterized protein LOC115171576 isoform X2 n=1 Tax=Salmo trutta TaxID=8032 RepID=UPI0011328FC8|nr:uncharacterized protein LOC115171576 isoform X2 [Salmo trutta]
MSISYLFGLLLTILLIQGCWGGEETKNVSCASLRTGNAYKYCVKDKEKPKRVEWQSVDSNKTSMWLATWLCQNKDTTHTHNVIDVNYSCITLPECVNVDHTAISNVTEYLTHFIVFGASDEPKELLEKEPDSQKTIADDVKQDVDNENPNHDNTHTWLFPACTLVKISCGQLKSRDGRYVYPYIPGVFDIAVFNMNGTAIANSGGDKPMEFDKNEVATMNNSSITLYKCQNLKMNIIYINSTQKAEERCSHYIVTEMRNEVVTTAPLNSTIIPDGDNPDTNHGDTSLTWKIIVGVVALVLAIAGLLLVFFCVVKPWRDKQCNQANREVEAGQGNPEPNSIPLMQNERRDARDIRKPDDGETVEAVVVPSDQGGEPGEENRQPMDNEETGADTPLLNGDASGQGVEDGKPSDNDRADTETCQKTHVDSPPLNVPKVVRVNSQTDDTQLLGQPQSNGHVPYRRESHLTNGAPGQGAGETPPLRPLLCRSPGEEGVLEGQDRKSGDCGGADPESCQKTHAEPPLVNGHPDVRVNDETKEVTPGAQSPGPPQMNGGPPMSNRAAEETTALLDQQALDKDQVTKPPELIDKGPNDMESRRGEL